MSAGSLAKLTPVSVVELEDPQGGDAPAHGELQHQESGMERNYSYTTLTDVATSSRRRARVKDAPVAGCATVVRRTTVAQPATVLQRAILGAADAEISRCSRRRNQSALSVLSAAALVAAV